MKTFLVIAAVLACGSAKPRFDSGQGLGSWSGNGQDWSSWSDDGQDWSSWSGNGLDWSSWSDDGQDWSSWLGTRIQQNRHLSLSNLCQLLQLINNNVQWPACSAAAAAAPDGRTAAEVGVRTAASLSQLCQMLQSINNSINWPVCQIAAALGQ